jgi:hypothetical protein
MTGFRRSLKMKKIPIGLYSHFQSRIVTHTENRVVPIAARESPQTTLPFFQLQNPEKLVESGKRVDMIFSCGTPSVVRNSSYANIISMIFLSKLKQSYDLSYD